ARMSEIQTQGMSRRSFLKRGGGIVVGFSLLPSVMAQVTAPPLPGSLQTNRMLDGWLRINADGRVTVFTGKVELGQGILTALAQIAADELDVNYERIDIVSADTSRSPNEGMTAGSQSVEQSGTALHYAAAEARDMLMQLAAAKLGVPVDALSVTDGMVSAGGARTTYWELAQNANFKREATARVKPKAPSRRNVIGKSVPRRDIPCGRCPASSRYCGTAIFSPSQRSVRSRRSRPRKRCVPWRSGRKAPNCRRAAWRFMNTCLRSRRRIPWLTPRPTVPVAARLQPWRRPIRGPTSVTRRSARLVRSDSSRTAS
ncbi:MAG: hypothetical protein EBT83_18965, partial [Betaproteobacteria bacterium]|nr:hypothetical protein [Betaproteobacteria bacterium]